MMHIEYILIIIGLFGVLLNRYGRDDRPMPSYHDEPGFSEYPSDDLSGYFEARGIKFTEN